MSKSLKQVQQEVRDWAQQFGVNCSKNEEFNDCEEWIKEVSDFVIQELMMSVNIPSTLALGIRYSIKLAIKSLGIPLQELAPFLGKVEELGELAGAMVKRHQGRGFKDPEEYHKHVADALADEDVFTCDFANRVGVDLEENLSKTWNKVKNRKQKTWNEDKIKENDPTNKHVETVHSEVAGKPLKKVPAMNDSEVLDQRLENVRQVIMSMPWNDLDRRKELYSLVAQIGLEYGDDPQTNIEEGLARKLSLLCEEAIAVGPLLAAGEAQRIVDKLNGIRKLNPGILGEPHFPIHIPIEQEYKEKFIAKTSEKKTEEEECDHEDPDRTGFCIKCQAPWEDWENEEDEEE